MGSRSTRKEKTQDLSEDYVSQKTAWLIEQKEYTANRGYRQEAKILEENIKAN